MAMTEAEYEREIRKVKVIVKKIHRIGLLTDNEKALIRTALVDYFVDKIEMEDDKK